LAYDKLSLSLTFKSVSIDEKIKGATRYFNISNSFGGQKYIVESSIRRYKSFFDSNSPNYNSAYTPPSPFFINKDLRAVSIKSKALFFSNHERFSYRSAYSLNYRQLKSAATFLLAAGIQYNNWKSESFFAPDIKNYYEDMVQLKKLTSYALIGGFGGSANIILLKRLFINLTAILTPEVQTRYYIKSDQTYHRATYISASFDSRVAFGINTKHFVYSVNSLADWSLYNNSKLEVRNAFLSASANIGFRINLSRFEPLNRLKENKYYKLL
jgi:hypothetical protein